MPLSIKVETIEYGRYKFFVSALGRNFSILYYKGQFLLAKELDKENCYLSTSEHDDLVGIIKANLNNNVEAFLLTQKRIAI